MAAYSGWAVEVAWTSDPDDAVVVWEAMTNVIRGDVTITRGRTDELSEVQPSTCSFELDNRDHSFLPGNTTSYLYPDVRLSKRVRIRITVGANTYTLFTGFITEIEPGPWRNLNVDQTVRISCVDRLGRLANATEQQSVMVAQNVAEGGDALVAYYPLGEGTDSLQGDNASRYPQPSTRTLWTPGAYLLPQERFRGSITFGDTGVVPADGLNAPKFVPDINPADGNPFGGPFLYVAGIKDTAGAQLALTASGQTITLVAWANLKPAAYENASVITLEDQPDGAAAFDLIEVVSSSGVTPLATWQVTIDDGSWGVTGFTYNTGAIVEWDRPILVGVHIVYGVSAELWIDGSRYTIPTSGTIQTPWNLNYLHLGLYGTLGSIAHAQIYKDTATSQYTYDDHVAQRDLGWTALAGQTTSERITTLAGYDNIAAADLAVQTGGSPMGRLDLVDRTAYDAMREAVFTENGMLFVAGDGKLTFHNRLHRYNQTVAGTFDRLELAAGLELRMDGPVINDASVKRTDGSTARSVDNASVAEHGNAAVSVELHARSDAECLPAAQWRTLHYAQPKPRFPALTFELVAATDALRDRVLARELGDRIALTGMPATTPPNAIALNIEGITHRLGLNGHRVEWTTRALLGAVAGTPDSVFKLDVSQLDGTHKLAY